MLNYLIRRIWSGLVTLLLITFLVYALIRNMPGTPLTVDQANLDPSKQISDADYKRLERVYGLDKPWPVAYFQWLGNTLRLDLGRSFQEKKPVRQVLARRMGPTLLLSITSLSLTYMLAVPMGLFGTVRRGKIDERITSTILYMLYSFPSFVTALLLLSYFYKTLQGTAFQLEPGITSDNYEQLSSLGKTWDLFKHMILPVTCYTYGALAYLSRFVKANMEEVIRQDYIRTARAKGVGPVKILVHHAFRNTLIPFVTLLGLTLPALLSGSVILEQIFSWPGMGQLYLQALTTRDYPVIMALTLMFAVLTLLGQLLADIFYAVVDPRVTYT